MRCSAGWSTSCWAFLAAGRSPSWPTSLNREDSQSRTCGRPSTRSDGSPERTNRNDLNSLARNLDDDRPSGWRPFVAVDAFCRGRSAPDTDVETQSGTRAIPAVARRVSQVPRPLCGAGEHWRAVRLAVGRDQRPTGVVLRNGRKPALLTTGSRPLPSGTASGLSWRRPCASARSAVDLVDRFRADTCGLVEAVAADRSGGPSGIARRARSRAGRAPP